MKEAIIFMCYSLVSAVIIWTTLTSDVEVELKPLQVEISRLTEENQMLRDENLRLEAKLNVDPMSSEFRELFIQVLCTKKGELE